MKLYAPILSAISILLMLFIVTACDPLGAADGTDGTDGGEDGTDTVAVTAVSLDITDQTILPEATFQLSATVTPEDASDTGVAWSSSDDTVATVNSTGLVTAVGAGSATITVTTDDGGYTASCETTVSAPRGTLTEIMERGELVTEAAYRGVDITVDANGIPYIALNAYDADLAAGTKASVEVWEYSGTATSWSRFDTRVAVTDDEAYAPGIVVHDGTVYVAYEYFDDINDPRYEALVVACSSGSGWSCLGGDDEGSLIKNGNSVLNGYSELAVKEDGTLMVAQISYGDGFVHYFDGTSWVSYNGFVTDGTGFWAGDIEIACFGNIPYVSLQTGSGVGIIGVLNGSETNGEYGQWEWLGGSYANPSSHDVDTQSSIVPLALDSSGNVYIAYGAYVSTADHPVLVKTFGADADDWETMYSDNSDLEQAGIVVADDVAYLLTVTYDSGIDIFKDTGDGWTAEGFIPAPDLYYLVKTAAGTNGEFYIAYECNYNHGNEVGVYKYAPYSP